MYVDAAKESKSVEYSTEYEIRHAMRSRRNENFELLPPSALR